MNIHTKKFLTIVFIFTSGIFFHSEVIAQDTTKPHNADTIPKTNTSLPSNPVTKPVQDTTRKADSAKAVLPGSTLTNAAPVQDTSKRDSSQIISGMATSVKGKPLDGAIIKSSAGAHAIASQEGAFKVPYVKGEQITVSHVGFRDTVITIDSFPAFLTVTLSGDTAKHVLQDVKVTALGLTKNGRSVGYAVTDIKGDAVQTAKETNFVNALQGKVAGLQINTNDGSMGGSTKVTIRGNKSITGNNSALFVIDGVFVQNQNFTLPSTYNQAIGGGGYDYGSPIQDINPDDIQTVSVLKGAAATALYGSRGSNGVILITTKKANTGKLGIDYSLNVQMDKVYILPDYQNEYGGGAATADYHEGVFDTLWYNENPTYFKNKPTYNDPVKGGYDLMPQYAVDESWGPKLEGQIIRPYYSFDPEKKNPYFGVTAPWSPQPDNVRDYFKTGLTTTNSVSVGGNNDKGMFRVSYSNMTQNYIVPNSRLMRNNLGFNGTYNLTDKLSVTMSANYSINSARGRIATGFSGSNPMEIFSMYGERQLDINMLKYYEFPDGSQVSWNRKTFDDPTPASATSPYWHNYKDYESDKRERLFGQAGFDYKPVDWINVSARVYMDKYNTLQEERTWPDKSNGQLGAYTRAELDHQEFDYQLLVNGKKDLSKSFNLNVTLGGNIMKQDDNVNYASISGLNSTDPHSMFNLNNGLSPIVPYSLNPRKQINSLFADATLGYNDLMYLELTGRNDWSSTLPVHHNSYFYPSASYSFVFSNLLSQWKWLTYGKFRASVAKIGSDTDPYETYLSYAAPVQFGSSSYILQNPYMPNNNLRPERATEVEAGLELKFVNNRVGVDFTAYHRITDGLIIPLSITPTTGYTNIYENAGKSRNEGIEVGLTGTPFLSKSFSWTTGINFSLNRSKLLSLQIPGLNNDSVYVVGTERRRNSVSTEAIVGKPLYQLTGTDYTYDNQGNKMVDANGHYIPTGTGQILGNLEPKYIGGFTNTFTYKNISLSALIDFQEGGAFFSYTNMYGLSSGLLEETAANDVREKGVDLTGVTTPDGVVHTSENPVHLQAADYFKNDFGITVNKANVYDASYIYLREVTLGWKLPEAWASAVHASNASISLYGRNLWLIHRNAPNVDPSNLINSDSNIMGMEGGALPSVRSYGINLKVGF